VVQGDEVVLQEDGRLLEVVDGNFSARVVCGHDLAGELLW